MSQTAKVLLLYAHPESQDSVANRVLLEPALQLPNVTVHDLYAHYPDFFIDIAYEQDLLRQHEVIVFQHPLYTRRERTGGKVLAQRDHYRRA
ncbi:glutathione-regulated potassium-efflux system ancillary protein KefG [Klebsiella pneumoniae]|nr:glutathione-regulated potassium-efflux system ancillary protein KefG [Klebsiella pneumoniae]